MKNIIIDCDPGIDDAVAIFFALANKDKLNIKAITTVCGNNSIENVTKNAQYIMSVSNCDCVLAAGASRPILNEPMCSDMVHGKNGMEGFSVNPEIKNRIYEKNAVETIAEIILASDEKITIVAIGPLTNIALFIRLYSELTNKIEMISIMGGGIGTGNITKNAEFNIYADPEAAKIVFDSNIPIVMSGLNITEEVKIYKEDLQNINSNCKLQKFFCEIVEFYCNNAIKRGKSGCTMHDSCAVAYLLRPDLFKGVRTNVSVELSGEMRGATVKNDDENGNHLVLLDVDAREICKIILESIEKMK